MAEIWAPHPSEYKQQRTFQTDHQAFAGEESPGQQLPGPDRHRGQLRPALHDVPNGKNVGARRLLFVVADDVTVPEIGRINRDEPEFAGKRARAARS